MYKIFVGNLNYDVTEDVLRSLFGSFGIIGSVKIVTDHDTGQPRGFGFVEMIDQTLGRKAIAALNGTDFAGRKLNVTEARPKEDRANDRRESGQRRYNRY